jgi:broad specificity phosphatase PhoE
MAAGGVDAELTEKGVAQVEALRPRAQAMVDAGLELVISSSMRRNLRTAAPFAGLVPIVAMDLFREVPGQYNCDKRRPLDEIRTDFPDVDLSACSETDTYWVEDREQARLATHGRILEGFEAIALRPERMLAVVSHGDTFSQMMRSVERVWCEVALPAGNCDVVAAWMTKGEDGVFTLAAYNAPAEIGSTSMLIMKAARAGAAL